jgi:hypothetical protein
MSHNKASKGWSLVGVVRSSGHHDKILTTSRNRTILKDIHYGNYLSPHNNIYVLLHNIWVLALQSVEVIVLHHYHLDPRQLHIFHEQLFWTPSKVNSFCQSYVQIVNILQCSMIVVPTLEGPSEGWAFMVDPIRPTITWQFDVLCSLLEMC